ASRLLLDGQVGVRCLRRATTLPPAQLQGACPIPFYSRPATGCTDLSGIAIGENRLARSHGTFLRQAERGPFGTTRRHGRPWPCPSCLYPLGQVRARSCPHAPRTPLSTSASALR